MRWSEGLSRAFQQYNAEFVCVSKEIQGCESGKSRAYSTETAGGLLRWRRLSRIFAWHFGFRSLAGGFEDVFGGENNGGDAVAVVAGVGAFRADSASDEYADDVSVEREGG